MNHAQSRSIPPEGEKPSLSDIGWLAPFAARGLWELCKARIAFARFEAREIPERNRAAKSAVQARGQSVAILDRATLERISYVIPRISDRLPWRSDCLIQAIAGQNWLKTLGAASEIRIGVENPNEGSFGAHAWLVHEHEVVTGGEIDRYTLLLADSFKEPETKPE